MENYLFKILLGGCVGHKRSEIMSRFSNRQFHSDTRMIIGIDFAAYSLNLPENEGVVTLQMWDFSEEKQFRSLISLFSRGASGAILYFDLQKLETLFELEEWVTHIRQRTKNIPIILCGVNCYAITESVDQHAILHDNIIQDFIHKHHLNGYFRISMKTGCNIHESFEYLSTLMVQQWPSLNFEVNDRITQLLQHQTS